MNKSKQLGTKAESAIVRYIQPNGFPHAERRSLRGAYDAGDITGTPSVAWEVKGGDAARTASDGLISKWMAELAVEVTNANATAGVLVVQRAGVGPANAGRWWAWMTAHQFVDLAMELDPDDLTVPHAFPVRMLLADAVALLRAAGYGEPEPDPNACDTPGHPSRPSGWCPICHGEEDERAAALADVARPVVAASTETGAETAACLRGDCDSCDLGNIHHPCTHGCHTDVARPVVAPYRPTGALTATDTHLPAEVAP